MGEGGVVFQMGAIPLETNRVPFYMGGVIMGLSRFELGYIPSIIQYSRSTCPRAQFGRLVHSGNDDKRLQEARGIRCGRPMRGVNHVVHHDYEHVKTNLSSKEP